MRRIIIAICLLTYVTACTKAPVPPQHDVAADFSTCMQGLNTLVEAEDCTKQKFYSAIGPVDPAFSPGLAAYFQQRGAAAKDADEGRNTYDQYKSRIDTANLNLQQSITQIQASEAAKGNNIGNFAAGLLLVVAAVALVAVAAHGNGGGGGGGASSHQGCCSWHGGSAGYCAVNGHLQCNDGTPSPSCGC